MSNVEKINRTAENSGPTTFEIKLSDLKLASEAPKGTNIVVRKSNDVSGMDELKASIAHVGVIYPLITTNIQGVEYVVAGNRRLKCLRDLYGAQPNTMVTIVHASEFGDDDSDVRELAMAVNIALPPHPVDRYEVLAAQMKAGLDAEEVASRNALTLAQVKRILALAELAPEIRDAWREGNIAAEVAQAFTLAPSKDDQVKLYEKLASQNHISAWQIQQKFVPNGDAGVLLEFVGIENYEAAGGKVRRDLFGQHHTVSDLKLVQKLASGRLKQECDTLIADGWSFALEANDLGNDRYAYGQIEPAKITQTKAEKEKMAALTARVEANDDDDEAAVELEDLEGAIKLRAYTDDHKKRSGCFVAISNTGELEIAYGKVKPVDKRKEAAKEAGKKPGKVDAKGKPAAPEASGVLKSRLESQMLKATAAAIVTGTQGGKGLGPLLGRIIAMQITPERPAGMPVVVLNRLDEIRKAIEPKIMQAAIAQAFDDKDYFNSVPKRLIVAAVAEAMGTDHAIKVDGMTTALAAKFSIANVAKTGWLPKELRVPGYDAKKGKRK